MNERRSTQVKAFKELREALPDKSKYKVKLIKDKLCVDKELKDPGFEINKLDSLSEIIMDYGSMVHSEELEYKGSVFQGHMVSVSSAEEAISARECLFQNPRISKADHLIYAYSVTDITTEEVVNGNSDDGEYSASVILHKLLCDRKCENMFLCVSRIHDGPNLGRTRFELQLKTLWINLTICSIPYF